MNEQTEKLTDRMETTLINQHKFDRGYARVISRQMLVACKEAGLKFVPNNFPQLPPNPLNKDEWEACKIKEIEVE